MAAGVSATDTTVPVSTPCSFLVGLDTSGNIVWTHIIDTGAAMLVLHGKL